MPRVSPEIKAAALAALHAGEQPAVVADRLELDPALVRKWKERHVTVDVTQSVTPDVTPQAVRPRAEAQQIAIGELVLDLLRAKLEASQAIATAAREPAWLARQTAADLAALGEYFDRTALAFGDRLAGAGERDAPPDDA